MAGSKVIRSSVQAPVPSCPYLVTLEPYSGDVRRYDVLLHNRYPVFPDRIPARMSKWRIYVTDKAHRRHIYKLLAQLPEGRQRRFQKKYVRRCALKAGVRDQSFDDLAAIFYTDCRNMVRRELSLHAQECAERHAARPAASVIKIRPRTGKHGLKKVVQKVFPTSEWTLTERDVGFKPYSPLFAMTEEQRRCRVERGLFNVRKRNIHLRFRGKELRDKLRAACWQFRNDVWGWVPDGDELPLRSKDEYWPIRYYDDKILLRAMQSNAEWQMMEQPSEEVSGNITFEDEAPISNDTAHTSGSITLPDTTGSIREGRWTMEDVLTREYPVEEFEWTTSQEWTTPIVNLGLPKAITDDINSLITRQLSFFAFARFGVKIRIQLNGTPFHNGALLAYIHPLSWVNDTTVNKSSIFAYAHGFLDASKANSVTLEFPFTHLHAYFAQCKGMIKDDSMNALGTLFIRVLNKLQAGTGASTILSGTVYMSLINPELHQPIHGVNSFSYGTGFMQGLFGEAVDMAGQWTGGLVTGAGHQLLNWLGVKDKPSDPLSSQPIINRTGAPVCHGAGLDRSIRLSLSPVSQTDTTPDIIGTKSSDFSLQTLCQIPSLIKTFTWNDQQKAGTLLYSSLATPVFIDDDFMSLVTKTTGSYTKYYPSMLAYISRGFCYYRGSLILKIQFIATELHGGRIAIVFDTHGTADVLNEDFESNKCNNTIIVDLKVKKEIIVKIPYFSVKPWLRCDHFRSWKNVKQTDPGVQNKVFLDSDIMGIIRFFVLGRLVHPATVSSSIDVNLFVYAGDDFELAVPNSTSLLHTSALDETARWQSLRYPYCHDTKTKICDSEDYIYDLWTDGFSLYKAGLLGKIKDKAPSDLWIYARIIAPNYDTLTWKQKVLNLVEEGKTDACVDYIRSLPKFETLIQNSPPFTEVYNASAQMLTELSTRESFGNPINILHGSSSSSGTVEKTLSENAFNLQTVWRRYYPLYISPSFTHYHAFTLITVPVSPTFTPSQDVFSTPTDSAVLHVQNLLSYLNMLFVYYRGGMRFKIYIRALNTDVYVWHNPIEAQGWSVTSGVSQEQICEQMNFAGDIAITQTQQCIEVEVPMASSYLQLLGRKIRHTPDLRSQNGTLYIAARNVRNPFSISIFVSTADDFHVNLIRSAPVVHEPWALTYSDKSDVVKYPELARNMQYISSNVQIPGSFVFNEAANGKIGLCSDINAASPRQAKMRKFLGRFARDTRSSEEEVTAKLEPIITSNDLILKPPHIKTPIKTTDVDASHMNLNYFRYLVNRQEDLTEGEWWAMHSYWSRFRGDIQMFGMEEFTNIGNRIEAHIERVMPQLRATLEQAQTTFETLGTQAISLNSKAEDFCAMGRRVETQLTETLDHLTAATTTHGFMAQEIAKCGAPISNLFGTLHVMVKGALIGTLVGNFYEMLTSGPSFTLILNSSFMLCYIFEVSPVTVVGAIVEYIFEGSPPQANEGQAQLFGLEDLTVHDGLTAALAILATTIYCAIFGKVPSLASIKHLIRSVVETGESQGPADWLRSVHFATMGIKSVSQVYDFFKVYSDKIISYILGKDSKEVLIEREFKEKADEVLRWIEEIEKIDDEDYLEQALQDIESHNALFLLVEKGKTFTREVVEGQMPKNLKTIISDANRKLSEVVKRWQLARPGHGYRYSPMSVLISGQPGLGKSQVSHGILDVVKDVLRIPQANSTYTVALNDKYFSAYNTQPIVIWDDMLQNKDQDELVTSFIQWCSTLDCRLNMAGLAEKGKLFQSKFILLTSNVQYPILDNIRDQVAFLRRRHIHIYMQFKDGWDIDRVKGLPNNDPEFQHADFFLKHPIRDEVLHHFDSVWNVYHYIALRMIEWDVTQREDIKEYLSRHESLRLPKGVILTVKPDKSAKNWRYIHENGRDHFYRADASGNIYEDFNPRYIGEYEVLIDPTLDEEEMVDAEMAVEELQEQPQMVEILYLAQFRDDVPVARNSTRWFSLAKRKIEAIKNKVTQKVSDFYKKHPNYVKVTGVIAAIVASGFILNSFKNNKSEEKEESPTREEAAKSFKKPVTQVITSEGATGKSQPIEINGSKIVAENAVYSGAPRTRIGKVAIEGCVDKTAMDIARNKLYPAMAQFGWDFDGCIARLQGVCIGGKVCLLPRHFFMKARDGDFFYFVRNNDKIQVEYNSINKIDILEKDACLYYMGARFDSKPKILNCFAKEEEILKLNLTTPAMLIGLTADGIYTQKSCVAKANQKCSYPVYGGIQYLMTGWQYDIDTQKGDCGSLLLACTNRLSAPQKIVGMHTAGYHDQRGGFSVIFTQEQISNSLDELVRRHGMQVFPAPLPVEVGSIEMLEKVKVIPQGHFTLRGIMAGNMCPSQPQKTSYRPTPFQGLMAPVSKAPALLKPVGDISPLKHGLSKYGKLTTPFKTKFMDIVEKDILNDLLALPFDLPAKAVTMPVAVFGLPGVPYCEKMNMNSSPGWPYQVLPEHRGQKGKAYLFGDEEAPIKSKFLKEMVEAREKAAREGLRVQSIWRDCLKDELRPIEKVSAGKTRLFTIAPVDLTILVRKYFLSFEQMFYKNYSKFFSAVGINPESYDWTRAYHRLLRTGDRCIAGDFANFDGKLMAEFISRAIRIINSWYAYHGEEDTKAANVRVTIGDELIHTDQLVLNLVYQSHQGNKSGNPITVILNTMANAMYMRCSWLEIMSEKAPEYATMLAYHENVTEEMYGDDNRLTVMEKVLPHFNQISITDCLAAHGIEYTDELKTGNLVPWRKLIDTSFLKRSYRIDDEIGRDIVLPVMDVATLNALTNWYRDGIGLEEQLQANQRSALGFAFFHGRKFYDNFNYEFCRLMREEKLKPLCITYDELLNLFVTDMRDDGTHFNDLVGLNFAA
ncbi:hypothetical protein [Wuhan spider virus 3]|uniref:hypothetical protein n=1 Tax=Wuhan spider virus 3 TaxID=1923752 RepID=UPI00090C56CF|nr:hypothetical protein [Wuhan spider virus 3]APG77429.1 hypothetical protein [Wuhan spider virus 3]